MNNKGFTLVELLSVIVLISLLMVIAIPNAIKIRNKINEKAYDTKIELIEQAAVSYGMDNQGETKGSFCVIKEELGVKNINIFDVETTGSVPCAKHDVQYFVDKKVIKYDEDKNVLNPYTGESINKCDIYLYQKNSRVYAVFDKENCNK